MRAIVIKQYGGPDVLAIEERPDPVPTAGHVLIEVKAFGLNRAELYFRQGAWGDVAEISGIECVGVVKADPTARLKPGQKVLAVVGGMGRSINGSYAELVNVPAGNVATIETELGRDELATIPESYAPRGARCAESSPSATARWSSFVARPRRWGRRRSILPCIRARR
jgi:NADPH:quinone reductase